MSSPLPISPFKLTIKSHATNSRSLVARVRRYKCKPKSSEITSFRVVFVRKLFPGHLISRADPVADQYLFKLLNSKANFLPPNFQSFKVSEICNYQKTPPLVAVTISTPYHVCSYNSHSSQVLPAFESNLYHRQDQANGHEITITIAMMIVWITTACGPMEEYFTVHVGALL